MTEEELQAIQERADAAILLRDTESCQLQYAEFARTDVPALLHEVARLRVDLILAREHAPLSKQHRHQVIEHWLVASARELGGNTERATE